MIRPDLSLPIPERIAAAHFIGIGGSGMSGLARMFLDRGRYRSWRDIQDAYPDYMASLGPWPESDIIEFLPRDFGPDESHWPFTRSTVVEFFESGAWLLMCYDTELKGEADAGRM